MVETIDKIKIKEYFLQYLSEINANIKETDNETIVFDYENLTFLAIFDKDDINYMRLMLPSIAEVNEKTDNIILYKSINNYNSKYKTVKTIVTDGCVWLSAEQFIYSTENVNVMFSRLIQTMREIVTRYWEEKNKCKPHQ